MGQGIDLAEGEKLRPFLVIVADVVHGLGNPFHCRGPLGLDDEDGDAVHEEHDVRTDVGRHPVAEGELVGDMKPVGLRVVRIEQPDVPLLLLLLHEDGLQPFQVSPGIQVALDVRPHADELLDRLLGSPVVHNPRIEPLDLLD